MRHPAALGNVKRSRTRFAAYFALAIGAAIAFTAPAAAAQASSGNVTCDTLPQDSYCSSWVGKNFVVRGPQSGVANIQEFNKVMAAYYNLATPSARTQSLNFFRQVNNCSNWDGSGLRYYGTVMCGLYAAAAAAACGNTLMVCQDVCNQLLSSLKSVFQNPNYCANTSENSNFISMLTSVCQSTSTPCASAIEAEQVNCGFSDYNSAKAYCDSKSTDTCCQNLSNGSTSNTGMIVGVVLGVIGGILLLSLLVFGFTTYRRKKRLAANSEAFQGAGSHGHLGGGVPGNEMLTATGGAVAMSGLDDGVMITEKTMEVWQNFDVRNSDEIPLRIGDYVHVENVFTDEWAWGVNLTTKQEGAFPFPCVKEIDRAAPGPINHHVSVDSSNMKPRVASLYIRGN